MREKKDNNCGIHVNLVIGTTLIGKICNWGTFFDIALPNWDIYYESVHLPKTVLNPS